MISGAAALALSAAVAHAQESPAPAPGTAVQEVVVTGSRIPQPNLTSVSPLTTLSSQDIKLTGTTNIETLLNDLPQAYAAQTSQVSNGASGTAQADLRNLGPQRTLVLVDGRRLMPGDPAEPFPDLNVIPAALVDRVDVVTGGASAVYGSDAVAGVLNFIMKKDFQGFQVDYQISFDNHQNNNKGAAQSLAGGLDGNGVALPDPGNVGIDGVIHTVSVIFGANSPDDKGNVTAYATYRHIDPVLQSTRDFSYCGIGSNNPSGTPLYDQHLCIGSSNNAHGWFANPSVPGTGLSDNPAGGTTFVPYTGALSYNFNPLNFLQREDNNYTGGFFAHYTVNPMVEVYSDFMFMDDQTNAQIAPSGLFRDSGPDLASGFTFNCNNPLMSLSQAEALCPDTTITPGAPGGGMVTDESIGYRFISQPRNADIRHTDYKVDIGFRGDLGMGWHYDAYLQYGTSILQTLTTGYGSLTNISNALNVIYAPGTTTPVCVTGGSCVPLNIFQASSAAITPQQLTYATEDALTSGQTSEQIVSGSLTGDLGHYGIKSPFSSEGVGVAFGAEYRRDTLTINFDEAQQTGDLSGGGGQALPVSGSTQVKEVYTEIRVPLVSDAPLIKSLVLDAGYRYSDYQPAGDTSTYKIEGQWSPTDDIRFRAGFNHAVRAPNVDELYAPQVTALASYVDPCALTVAGGPPTATLAQCENTGMTAAEYGSVAACPSSQCSDRTGGPSDPSSLKPEDADTYTVGVVFTPTFFHGFTASLDYFNIKVNNVIEAGIAAPQTILDGCLASASSPYCALIHRDPTNGALDTAQGYIDQLSINAGYLQTSGLDMAASYRLPIDTFWKDSHLGSIQWSFVGTYTFNLIEEPTPGGGTFDCAGLYGNECASAFGSAGVTPKFKSEFRTTWNTPWNIQISLNWRHISSVALDLNQTNPLLNEFVGFNDSIDAKIPNYDYFDLTATWKVKDGLVIRAGCNNLFDRDPPIVDAEFFGVSSPPFGNGNTFPGVYDSLGRNIFVGLTADF